MKKIFILFIIALLLNHKVNAQCPEQGIKTPQINYGLTKSGSRSYMLCQSFRPAVSGTLGSVELQFNTTPVGIETFEVTIADSSGSGHSLITSTATIFDVTSSGTQVIALTNPISVNANQLYSICLRYLSGSRANFNIPYCFDNGYEESYAFGNMWDYSSTAGTSGNAYNYYSADMYFKAFVTQMGVGCNIYNVSLCYNQFPYTWNGTSYTSPGNYRKVVGGNVEYLNLRSKDGYLISGSVNGDGNMTPLAPYVCAGDNQTFTITPNSGSTISDVIVDGISVGAVSTYTFTNVNTTHTISATFVTTSSCVPTSSTTNLTLCPTQFPYRWNGTNYSSAGSYLKVLTNASGCDSNATLNLVNANSVTVNPIDGLNKVCVGSSILLSNTTIGGEWSSSSPSRAVIDNFGVVTGVNGGSSTISYTLRFNPTCSKSVTKIINSYVNPPMPSIAWSTPTPRNPIAGVPCPGGGASSLCNSRTFTLRGFPSGGVFYDAFPVMTVVPISADQATYTTNFGGRASLAYTITDANGCSNTRSFPVCIVGCGPKNASSNTKQAELNTVIFPNPAHDFINFKFNKIAIGNIIINDLYGKQIITQMINFGNNSIDVSKLAKGVYFVNIITENERETKKVIIE